ncbi:helix-turn-helix domain-containing protein [Trueperella pyogenes]
MNNPTTPARDYLTVSQAAQALGVSTDTLYGLVARKQIPHKRIGRLIRIPAAYINITQGGTR